jgi:hypothetical protein
MTFRSTGTWAKTTGLGNESYTSAKTVGGKNYFYVVWRAGVITNEIMLVAPQGNLKMQNAIDLAKIQQTRAAKAR